MGRGMGRLTVVNHAGAAVVLEVQKKGGRCHSHLWILGEAPDEPTSKLRPTNYFTLGELSKGGMKERGCQGAVEMGKWGWGWRRRMQDCCAVVIVDSHRCLACTDIAPHCEERRMGGGRANSVSRCGPGIKHLGNAYLSLSLCKSASCLCLLFLSFSLPLLSLSPLCVCVCVCVCVGLSLSLSLSLPVSLSLSLSLSFCISVCTINIILYYAMHTTYMHACRYTHWRGYGP